MLNPCTVCLYKSNLNMQSATQAPRLIAPYEPNNLYLILCMWKWLCANPDGKQSTSWVVVQAWAGAMWIVNTYSQERQKGCYLSTFHCPGHDHKPRESLEITILLQNVSQTPVMQLSNWQPSKYRKTNSRLPRLKPFCLRSGVNCG